MNAATTSCLACLCMVAAGTSVAQSNTLVRPGLYALTTETVMPHLEEALRYATVKSSRCIAEDSADSYFPLLQHQAFAGCSLAPAEQSNTFTLICQNPEAAAGLATFENSASGMRAVLYLKMGGKNMTLSQRVAGVRLRDCR